MFQRTRWSALGAAVAVVLGAGVVLPSASAAINTGSRAVFVPMVPCRLFDTRPGADINVGPRATPIGPAEVYTQQVAGLNGRCNVPTDATAISMSVTAVGGTASGYLTVYPSDATERPQASNLNWAAGAPAVPNKVDVKLSSTGAINLFNFAGSVNDTLRTEMYSVWDMTWEQPVPVNVTIVNGCIGNTTGSGVFGEIPIHIPIGSRLISVDVATLDTAGSGTYSVELNRTTQAGAVAHFGSITLGGNLVGSLVVHTVISPPAEIATANNSYAVRTGGFDLSFNAFCGLSVTYDTKP